MAAGGFVGSLLFGHLSDHPRCNRIVACQFAILMMGVVSTLFTIASTFEWFVVLSIAFGVFDGCYEMLVPVITSDIVGIKFTPTAVGTLYCLLAIPKTIGPPVAGWIFDRSQSYNTAFYVTGGLMTLSSLIMFLIPTNVITKKIIIGSSDTQDTLIRNSEESWTSTESSTIPLRRKSALVCYGLRFKSKQTPEDYYTINTQEEFLVAEKVTTV